MTAVTLLGHITIDEELRTGACSVCEMSLRMPFPMRGPIHSSDMLASFAVAHAAHDRHGVPSGLTPTGRVSKSAAPIVRALMTELVAKQEAKP